MWKKVFDSELHTPIDCERELCLQKDFTIHGIGTNRRKVYYLYAFFTTSVFAYVILFSVLRNYLLCRSKQMNHASSIPRVLGVGKGLWP